MSGTPARTGDKCPLRTIPERADNPTCNIQGGKYTSSPGRTGRHVITTSPFAPTAPSPACGPWPARATAWSPSEVVAPQDATTSGRQRGRDSNTRRATRRFLPGKEQRQGGSDAPGRRPSRTMIPIREGFRERPGPRDVHTTRGRDPGSSARRAGRIDSSWARSMRGSGGPSGARLDDGLRVATLVTSAADVTQRCRHLRRLSLAGTF